MKPSAMPAASVVPSRRGRYRQHIAQPHAQASLRQLDGAGGVPWSAGVAVYPGLRPFDAGQARVFFGSDEDARQLAERLRAAADQSAGGLVADLLADPAPPSPPAAASPLCCGKAGRPRDRDTGGGQALPLLAFVLSQLAAGSERAAS
jgi:hypothetical protein